MKKSVPILLFLALLVLLVACVNGIDVPVPDRVDEETDINGNVIGIYETYEDEDSKEEVYKIPDENNNLIVKWILLTLFDEDKDPIEERFTHDDLLTSIKCYSYENQTSARDTKTLTKIEHYSEENVLVHLEEYTYDFLGRLVRIDYSDIISGEARFPWYVTYVYEGEELKPNEERILADSPYVNPGMGDNTCEVTTFIYYDNGLLHTKRTTSDGVNFDEFVFKYDEQSRLSTEDYSYGGEQIWTKTYLYEGDTLVTIELRDANGNLLKKKDLG